jgi:serine/threonine protein kinase
MPVTDGQNLAHYSPLEKIGEGGMSVVWCATDTKLDREVALGLLSVELAGNADMLVVEDRICVNVL